MSFRFVDVDFHASKHGLSLGTRSTR
jgi:hypothetical protein